MLLPVILILIGFVLLAKGADILVDGSCVVAHRYGVSDLVIGLTVVALGTSAPELIVSMLSVFKGSGEIAVGNILGSNIANLCLVLGCAGALVPITIHKGTVWKEIPFCLGTALLLLVILSTARDGLLVSRFEGIVLLGALGAYLFFMFRVSGDRPPVEPEAHSRSMPVALGLVAGGLAGLVFGGDMIVRNSIKVATSLGISEGLIGLTVVAIGTSLPELAASIAAVLKGKPDLAVGNVVGSNILNACLVLGLSATLRPIRSTQGFGLDALVGAGAALLLFIFMFTGRRHKLDRWEAILFLLIYVGYTTFIVSRG